MASLPQWDVIYLNGDTDRITQSFGDVLRSQKAHPESDISVSEGERLNLRIANICWRHAIKSGRIDESTEFEVWADTVGRIDPVDDADDADADPLASSEQAPPEG